MIQVHTAYLAHSGKDKPYSLCAASAFLKGFSGVLKGGPGGLVIGLCGKSTVGPNRNLGWLAFSDSHLPQHPTMQIF